VSTESGHDNGDQVAEVHYLPAARPAGADLEQSHHDDGQDSGGEVEPAPEVLEGEIVPDASPATWTPPTIQRREIVPPWVRDAEQRRAAARWAAGHALHSAKWHSARLPLVVLRIGGNAPRGLGRASVAWRDWVFDREAHALRQAAANGNDYSAYKQLAELRNARVKVRLVITAVAAVLVLVGMLVAGYYYPPAKWWLLASALAVSGVAGARRSGRPLLVGAAVPQRYTRLTEGIVLRALEAAGLGGKAAKVAKDGAVSETAVGTPALVQPIQRDGKGWLAIVDLPYGRTFADAMAKKGALASGLDVAAVQVFFEAHRDRERRVTLWVADEDPYAAKPRTSALALCPQVSVWDAQPLGVEPRGREVKPTLIFNSFLIGAVPRMGKTFNARALVAPAVLDPQCDLTILDLKGGRDWQGYGQCAVTYRSGDDDDDIAYAITALESLRAEARARFAAFKKMSDKQCPESKLTRDMAKDGLFPHVITVDEVQNLLKHHEHGKAALEVLTWLAKTAPAAGFLLVMATQRPSSDVIKTDLRDNVVVRIALRTMDWRSSDTILGASADSIGIESHSLMEWHKGVAVVRGISNDRGGDHQTIRTDLLSNEQCARLGAVGRQRRLDAGTLRGHAAGQADELAVRVNITADLLAIWPGDAERMQSAELCQRLARLRPERYHDLTPDGLTACLKPLGPNPVQVFRDGRNLRGYALADIRKAASSDGGPST